MRKLANRGAYILKNRMIRRIKRSRGRRRVVSKSAHNRAEVCELECPVSCRKMEKGPGHMDQGPSTSDSATTAAAMGGIGRNPANKVGDPAKLRPPTSMGSVRRYAS